jgi:hypothetical protein
MKHELVYIHIGKTGGTSFRNILNSAFGISFCSEPFVQKYMDAEDQRQYDTYPVICGHISRSDQLKFFPHRKIITILREPVDRCFSFINYVKSFPRESLEIAKDINRLSLKEWIDTPAAYQNLHNTMVRQLGGHMLDETANFPVLLENAKQTLRDALWFGRQETMSTDIARLSQILECELDMTYSNVTPNRPSLLNEPQEIIDLIVDLNAYDIQLWKWAEQQISTDSIPVISDRAAHAVSQETSKRT